MATQFTLRTHPSHLLQRIAQIIENDLPSLRSNNRERMPRPSPTLWLTEPNKQIHLFLQLRDREGGTHHRKHCQRARQRRCHSHALHQRTQMQSANTADQPRILRGGRKREGNEVQPAEGRDRVGHTQGRELHCCAEVEGRDRSQVF